MDEGKYGNAYMKLSFKIKCHNELDGILNVLARLLLQSIKDSLITCLDICVWLL